MNTKYFQRMTMIALIFLVAGAGCIGINESPKGMGLEQQEQKEVQEKTPVDAVNETSVKTEEAIATDARIVLPIEPYRPDYRRFGEYFEGRFTGYHAAEDVEVDPAGETAVRAIADGELVYKNWVAGYGGVVQLAHEIDNESIRAIYGHLDIDSVSAEVGDAFTKGEQIGLLGEHESEEVDGVREHLHFGLYRGEQQKLQGYELNASALQHWINPQDLYRAHGIETDTAPKRYSELVDPDGKEIFTIDFEMPAGWDVEYIPSIDALNLYRVEGTGTARTRSEMLIRYFDASDFLTLSTVTIHSSEDTMVGVETYTARRYDIEKKPGVAHFADQPAWRNERHMVTDFRGEAGQTRYYVVAANPDLDPAVYEAVLDSMRILK